MKTANASMYYKAGENGKYPSRSEMQAAQDLLSAKVQIVDRGAEYSPGSMWEAPEEYDTVCQIEISIPMEEGTIVQDQHVWVYVEQE